VYTTRTYLKEVVGFKVTT